MNDFQRFFRRLLDRVAPPVDRSKRTLTDGSPVTPGHDTVDAKTGMQRDYVVLSEEERAKGFVRPLRREYVHMKCGGVTWMATPIAETLARDPSFYEGGYCAVCKEHFPNSEFVWKGTDEQVGS